MLMLNFQEAMNGKSGANVYTSLLNCFLNLILMRIPFQG